MTLTANLESAASLEDLRESNLGIGPSGHLFIEACDSVDLVKRFGSPLWVVSESTIRNNYRKLRGALSKDYDNVILAYGSKAIHSPSILSILVQEGSWIDCVSFTQLELARRAGVSPSKIVFNGSNKSERELEVAVD